MSIKQTVDTDTPREEWPEIYRGVVEYFETYRDWSSFEADPGNRYLDDEPYVLHTTVKAPLRPASEKEYSWHILLNPWPTPGYRETFIADGRPLRPKHTAMSDESDFVASDDEITDLYAKRVGVFVALSKIVESHSRSDNWIITDSHIQSQTRNVIESLGGDDE